ncbi:MAG: hypothetical protein ACI4EF_05915 [Coprococcus sp.]
MKCNRCGNEFYSGNVCPNCGNPVLMENADATVAYNQEISVKLDDDNNTTMGTGTAGVYSHGTPQPQEGIFATQNMYGTQNMNGQGMPGQSMYGTQNMGGQGMPNSNMYGGYTQVNGYTQSNGYTQGNGYTQSNGYTQGNGYTQNNGYIGNSYGPNNQEPKKSKMPFIVAGIVLAAAVIAIILILVLVVFKDDDDEKKKNTTEATTTEATTTEDTTVEASTTEEPSSDEPSSNNSQIPDAEGTVIYSDDIVDLTYTKTYISKAGDFVIEGEMVNKSKGRLGAGLDMVDVNGLCFNGNLYGSAEAGEKGEWSLYVYASDMTVAGLKKITDVNIYFSVYSGETYEDITVDSMKVQCDISTEIKNAPKAEDWVVVYSDDICEVAALNTIKVDNEYDEYEEYLKVTNKTDKNVTAMLLDTLVDGQDVYGYGGLIDAPGKCVAYFPVYWHMEDFTTTPKFEKIEADFSVFDYKSYETYSSSAIEIKPKGIEK